jgi:hypothetical protein
LYIIRSDKEQCLSVNLMLSIPVLTEDNSVPRAYSTGRVALHTPLTNGTNDPFTLLLIRDLNRHPSMNNAIVLHMGEL